MLQKFLNIFKDEEDSDPEQEHPDIRKPGHIVNEMYKNPKLETWYSKKRERHILKKIKSQMLPPLTESPEAADKSTVEAAEQEGTAEMVKDFLFVREKESKWYY